ncbi:Ribonuclease H-like protein [Gracilaria domingensis]|nr:Ribonuclease H-like protein [Gracilaria domingensis]
MCPETTATNEEVEERGLRKSTARKELGASSFCLDEMFDSEEFENVETDVLIKYLERKLTAKMLSLLRDDSKGNGIIKFWIIMQSSLPDLSTVALRIWATPVSSAETERNFSTVNRTLSAERSLLRADIVEDLLYVNTIVKGW